MTKRTRPLTAARAALVAAALGALSAAGGTAQAGPGHPPCAHPGAAATPAEHLERLTPILGLSAAQQAAAVKMAREATARTEPLTQQARAQHDRVRALLEADSPDPARVGQEVIAMHALHEQLEAIHRQEMARFEKLLDAGQRAKLAKLHAGMHGGHGHGGPASDAD